MGKFWEVEREKVNAHETHVWHWLWYGNECVGSVFVSTSLPESVDWRIYDHQGGRLESHGTVASVERARSNVEKGIARLPVAA